MLIGLAMRWLERGQTSLENLGLKQVDLWNREAMVIVGISALKISTFVGACYIIYMHTYAYVNKYMISVNIRALYYFSEIFTLFYVLKRYGLEY